ncbi:TAP-like protein-domain-containing protein [Trichophaea hybrida]|nr:TAP-like protein-domain-containing protein [Trichophaea hybrida]
MPPIAPPPPYLPPSGDEKVRPVSSLNVATSSRRMQLLDRLRRAVVFAGILAFVLWGVLGFRLFSRKCSAPRPPRSSVPFQWSDVTPTPDLVWHPCFDALECARLQVPLDWTNPSDPRTVAIALAKVPAAVPETDPSWLGPVLINPGGPGGSGVELALLLGTAIQTVVGRTHSVIGFDPRGVNNTTPATTCFPSDTARVLWALRGRVIGSSAGHQDVGIEFARAKSLGSVCEEVINAGGGAAFAGTPNVARDMLAIVDASWKSVGKEKEKRGLRYWGFSYGTVLGQTFASMFPDRVERMVLDGVVDLDDYYSGGWLRNLQDSDHVIESFYTYCSSSSACDLTAATPGLVARRIKKLIFKLHAEPIPVYGDLAAPDYITESDVRTIIFLSLYFPIQAFPIVASVLASLEAGDAAPISRILHAKYECDNSLPTNPKPNTGFEAASAIFCQDGGVARSNSTLAEMIEYVEVLRNQSEMIGGNWAAIAMSCTGWRVPAHGLPPPTRKSRVVDTKNPILFVTTQLDPVTPRWNAEKARGLFKNAGLLLQLSEGHCSISAPSMCSVLRITRYFLDGTVERKMAVCEADSTPWGAPRIEEETVAWRLVRGWKPVLLGGRGRGV